MDLHLDRDLFIMYGMSQTSVAQSLSPHKPGINPHVIPRRFNPVRGPIPTAPVRHLRT